MMVLYGLFSWFILLGWPNKKRWHRARLDGPLVKIGCAVDFPKVLDLEVGGAGKVVAPRGAVSRSMALLMRV